MYKNKKVEISFKKLLGNGRAWRTPIGFTSDFLDVLVSPLVDLKEWFINLKYTHFTTLFQDSNNILNNEEMFDIQYKKNSLKERAEEVDFSWQMFYGNSHYKTLEKHLRRKGFRLYIFEKMDDNTLNLGTSFTYGNSSYKGTHESDVAQYGGHSARIIGNGFLNIEGVVKDPAQFINGKNCFYIKGYFDPTDEQWDSILNIVLRLKQAHEVAICMIAERKVIDNGFPETELFVDEVWGGEPETEEFMEEINEFPIG